MCVSLRVSEWVEACLEEISCGSCPGGSGSATRLYRHTYVHLSETRAQDVPEIPALLHALADRQPRQFLRDLWPSG